MSDGDAVRNRLVMADNQNKLIVGELLFFIKNKLGSMTKDAVVQMCAKFFFEEEIFAAITALEAALDVHLPRRYKEEDICVKVEINTQNTDLNFRR